MRLVVTLFVAALCASASHGNPLKLTQSVLVAEGEIGVIRCYIDDPDDVDYQWQYPVGVNSDNIVLHGAQLMILNMSTADVGIYKCKGEVISVNVLRKPNSRGEYVWHCDNRMCPMQCPMIDVPEDMLPTLMEWYREDGSLVAGNAVVPLGPTNKTVLTCKRLYLYSGKEYMITFRTIRILAPIHPQYPIIVNPQDMSVVKLKWGTNTVKCEARNIDDRMTLAWYVGGQLVGTEPDSVYQTEVSSQPNPMLATNLVFPKYRQLQDMLVMCMAVVNKRIVATKRIYVKETPQSTLLHILARFNVNDYE